jgi:hypothetical protein
MAEVTCLVFHTANAEDAPLVEAMRIITEDLSSGESLSAGDLIDRIDAMAFEWGRSEGT